MQLHLTLPATWPVRTVGEQRVANVPTPELGPPLVLAWGPLVPFPEDPRAWVSGALRAEVPPSMSVELTVTEQRRTTTGWSVRLVPAEVVREDGTVAEYRLAAFYKFFEYGAVAMVRSTSAAAIDACRTELVAALATGLPDWQADRRPLCVADLYR